MIFFFNLTLRNPSIVHLELISRYMGTRDQHLVGPAPLIIPAQEPEPCLPLIVFSESACLAGQVTSFIVQNELPLRKRKLSVIFLDKQVDGGLVLDKWHTGLIQQKGTQTVG